MNITHWLLLICTALTLASLTWWGCAWWYGRKLQRLGERLQRTRQAAGQHANQTRRQIAQLQKDLAALASIDAARAAEVLAQRAEEARLHAIHAAVDQGDSSRFPTLGFADTQAMS